MRFIEGVSIHNKANSAWLSGPGRKVTSLCREGRRLVFVGKWVTPKAKIKLWHNSRCRLAIDDVVNVAEVDVFPAWRGLLLHRRHWLNVDCLVVALCRLGCCCGLVVWCR